MTNAELRQLEAEADAYEMDARNACKNRLVRHRLDAALHKAIAENGRLTAQRDALLDACKAAVRDFRMADGFFTFRQIEAAIAMCEPKSEQSLNQGATCQVCGRVFADSIALGRHQYRNECRP